LRVSMRDLLGLSEHTPSAVLGLTTHGGCKASGGDSADKTPKVRGVSVSTSLLPCRRVHMPR
jgi:hypothetical protein